MNMGLHLVTGRGGKEHVTSADHGAFHVATMFAGNVVLNSGNTFTANVISNNLIKILDGELLMQGRHVRLESGSYIEVPIENGSQDYKRNDLIVVKYTKDAASSVESVCLEVIKGTATTGTATDPAYNPGSILNGDLEAIFPLYRVPIVGIAVQEPEAMFEISDNFDKRLKKLASEKVDKVAGKGLSANDYTDAEKEKLKGIADGANKYTHPNSGVTAGTYRSVTVNAAGHVTGGSNPTLPVSAGGTGNTSVDTTPTSGSTKMVTSGGVYTALSGKAASSHNHSASNITSGTLAIARGGTGATSATAALSNLGTVPVTINASAPSSGLWVVP